MAPRPRGAVTDVRVDGRDVFVFDHDGAGRPVLVHEPGPGRTLTLGWTPGGRVSPREVDGATTRWQRYRYGALLARPDPAGRTTRIRLDPPGGSSPSRPSGGAPLPLSAT